MHFTIIAFFFLIYYVIFHEIAGFHTELFVCLFVCLFVWGCEVGEYLTASLKHYHIRGDNSEPTRKRNHLCQQ